jgi:FAD:protein FMN transferase
VSDAYVHSCTLMGTAVTIQVVGHGASEGEKREREAVVGQAVEWFRRIEQICTRFDEQSEARQLSSQVGVPVSASTILFEAVRFAIAVAEESEGAFDPTVGHRMEARGFNKEYRSGHVVRSSLEAHRAVSYRDVRVDPDKKTITLLHPLVLDLGAVAKGLAVDMAARELAPVENYAIDAGGDLYLSGHNARGDAWSVGIRHPRDEVQLIETLRVSNSAVCTSGDYERPSSTDPTGHHIVDPGTGHSPPAMASVTVLAPSAMVADALATAAFVLGPARGLELLERHGVNGLMITPTLERFSTPGMPGASQFHAPAGERA